MDYLNKFKKKIKFPLLKCSRGFTLLETLLTIFVITVGLIGGMTAILRTLNLSSFSSSNLIATYLAQEGIEIVRNIRDTNWLEARTTTNSWDEGLTNCTAGCIADYKHSYGPNLIDPNLPSFNEQFLNIDANGFYSYSPGIQTTFKRKITIQKPQPDRLDVKVEVTWIEKGKSYTFSTQENLYNWR